MEIASVQEGHVVRVTSRVQLPAGVKFIGVEEPVAILQYARDMSLARGRIVYEVFNQERRLSGYAVPSSIHTEAVRNCRSGNDARLAWVDLPDPLRTAHWDIRRKILDQFPNIDATAARLISERLISHNTQINKPNIEKAVVDHVIHMWTAFNFRLEQGESKESVIKAINPRTREVLAKWMGPDVRAERVGDLWKRWDLLDAPVPTKNVWGEELVYKEMDHGGQRRWGAVEEIETFYTPGAMTWFGGKETTANLACRSKGFT
ncbi:uncharacterized protein RHO25_008191 [Cercospora beticola]|uniref:Uncharacterized protein n=1 Tax=Cercospora beticola TaxID=122368 RepID=A0ABZ0NVP3_CERBT|nr:hypothetical protein RHO25_008191 [Cercospora beticola]